MTNMKNGKMKPSYLVEYVQTANTDINHRLFHHGLRKQSIELNNKELNKTEKHFA